MILEQKESKLLGEIAFLGLWEGNFAEAERIFIALHHNNPEKIGPLLGLAHAKTHQGNYTVAIDILENQALKLDPKDEHAKAWLGLAYFMANEKAKAKEILSELVNTCQAEDANKLAISILDEM